MVDLSGVDRAPPIVDRAKALILTPKEEWPKIASETTPQSEVLKSYVLPLAAIGPIASLIGEQVFGRNSLGYAYRPPIVPALIDALLQYVLTVVIVLVLAVVADMLAPRFKGESNRNNALKLVAYAFTAIWLAQAFALVPQLRFFMILGLYAVYLFYVGAGPLMKVKEENAAGFVAVTFICAVVGGFLLSLAIAPVVALFASLTGSPTLDSDSEIAGKMTVPGGSINDKIQQATKQMEAAANGKSPPVAPDRMKAMLPETILVDDCDHEKPDTCYQRTATEAVSAGPMGSTAQGTYTKGDRSFTLRIADMSALGALSGLGAAMGVEQSREDANSYEKTTSVNGQMQTEAWNKQTNSGKYAVTVNNRFMIEAEGSAANLDELKQAVATIDQDDLADLVG